MKTDSVEGSGIIKTESRKVSAFTSIDISGSYIVEISSQEAPTLEISADDNILPVIITEVRGETLFIYNDKNLYTKTKLKVKASSMKIEKISASGANILKIYNLNNETLNIAQSGSSKTEISGQTKELYITLSGASNVNAKKLYSQKVKVDISGAANADVYATEELNARVFGAGKVNYYGNPKNVNRTIAGVGLIKNKQI